MTSRVGRKTTVLTVAGLGLDLLLAGSARAQAERAADSKPATESKPAPPRVEWRDGKTRLSLDAAYLEISTRVQFRWTQELPDEKTQLPGTAAPGDGRGSFRIRRVKFKLEGWAYKPWLQFETQVNYPEVNGNPPGRILEDALINWDVTRGRKRVMARVGQFKVPFGRQELTSSTVQQFVDRSEVSGRYARGRDAGVTLWGVLGANRVEWRVGAFNGNGRTQPANDNGHYQYDARLVWQPNGAVPLGSYSSGPLYSESDFESTDRPIYALAASLEGNDKSNATTGLDTRDFLWHLDGVFKYKGLSVVAEYYHRRAEPESGALPPAGSSPAALNDVGWYVQAGYLLDDRRHWEVAGRYGQIDPSSLASGDRRTEIGAALGYYYNRHNLKVQADARRLEDRAKRTKDVELRVQAQLFF